MESFLLLKALALVAALLALLYSCYIIIQKRTPTTKNTKRLKISDYQRIDNKNTLCLVKSDSQEFLIAIGPSAIAIYPMNSPLYKRE